MARTLSLMLSLLLAVPTSVQAFTASITADCLDGRIAINVEVLDSTPPRVPAPEAYGGYVVVRYALGTCEEPEMLTEYSIDFTEDVEFIDTPRSTATPYLYVIHTLTLIGELGQEVRGHYRLVAVSCSNRPIFRGTVDDIGFAAFNVSQCADSCWMPAWLEESRVTASGSSEVNLRDYVGTGTSLDFYGRMWWYPELGYNYIVTGIEETPCSPEVALERQNWSCIKAMYR